MIAPRHETVPAPAAIPPLAIPEQHSPRFGRLDLFLILLLAALVALFFWRIITPDAADRAQFPPGDFTYQFYAFRLYEARSFAAGRLPLWSENFNSGHPFLADIQSAVLYPIGLADTLANVALTQSFSLFALELEALVHFMLAGAFTYLFAHRLIGSRAGAFVAALVFTFGGYLTSYPPLQLAILETAAWLPLALLLLDHAATDARWRRCWTAAAGLVLGVSALAGHPQTFLFVVLACAAYYAFRVLASTRGEGGAMDHPLPLSPRWLGDRWLLKERSSASLPLLSRAKGERYFSAFAPFLLSLLLALGIAAIQLVPALEYQRLSTREALSFREAAAGFSTLNLLQFILPGASSAFASPLYVGALPLWLGLVALAKRDRERWFWGLTALAALVLSFGFYVFAYSLFYALIPGAGLFRQQERFAFLVSFSLALLAGFGFSDLEFSPLWERVKRRSVERLFVFLPACGVVVLTLLLMFYLAGLRQAGGRIAFLGDRAALMVFLFVLASAIAGLYLRGWFSPRVLGLLALPFIVFDLFSINEPANKGAVETPYPPTPLVQRVQSDPGLFRVADEGQEPGHFGIGYQLEETGGISPLRLANYDRLLALDQERAWSLLGVRYVFSSRQAIAGAQQVGQEGDTRLYTLEARPRAWLVGNAIVEAGQERASEILDSPNFDPASQVVLASPAPFPPSPEAAPGSVVIVSRAPEHISLRVDAPADGLVVLAENYHPGWEAKIDGAPATLMPADLSLRAIPVRAGIHNVELVFDPMSLKIGAILSAIALVACVGLLLSWRRV